MASSQRPGGWWEGHWWCDHEYATALAVDGLRALSGEDERISGCLAESSGWAESRLGSSGAVYSHALADFSPFATALCCRILQNASGSSAASAAAVRASDWLLRQQLGDGSWRESAVMRVPPAFALPGSEHPHRTFFALDRRRVFTTATVLWALARHLASLGELEQRPVGLDLGRE